MQKSAFSNPVLIKGDSSESLERIGFRSGEDFEYNEEWLQDFLFSNPSSVPVEEIDSAFSGLVPICCELNTPAGPLDVLYVTPQGKLVIAEVKLWRNPEARRKVVAQVIDYAKELNKWDYEDLQREVSKQSGRKGNALFEMVKVAHPEIQEADFVDGVSRSLRKGDFLLLIIGDGIQEGTENITDFMNNVGRLQFTFGLVEMAIYRLSESDLIVQPKILAKSVIIERIVIDLKSDEIYIAHDDEGEEEQEVSDVRRFYTNFWSDYVDQMQLDDVGIPHSTATANNFYVYPGINKQSWISAFVAKSQQTIGVYFRAPKGEYGEIIYRHLLDHKDEIIGIIGDSVKWEDEGHAQAKFITTKKVFDDVHAEENRVEIFDFYNENINNYVNALRPLLKDFEP